MKVDPGGGQAAGELRQKAATVRTRRKFSDSGLRLRTQDSGKRRDRKDPISKYGDPTPGRSTYTSRGGTKPSRRLCEHTPADVINRESFGFTRPRRRRFSRRNG